MMRFIRIFAGALLMVVVMVVAAALTLRIALHGREVSVPNFAGMNSAESSAAALEAGLDLTIENKFYSTTVPSGRMLSQAPAAGSRVRHGWQVRVTQSLGPQQVTIPDVAGEPVREAAMDLRRDSLDLGTIVHLEAPGDPDIVLTQTPPPNAGVDQPRVSLLLSSAAGEASNAMVMPSFVGMSYSAANHAGMALGLRVYYVADAQAAPAAPSTPVAIPPGSVTIDSAGAAGSMASVAEAPVVPSTPGGPVTAQKPEAGSRVFKGEAVRITFGHPVQASSGSSSAVGSAVPSATNP